MSSKRFWILIISALLVLPFYKLVRACSDGPDPYDYFPSFFQNGATPTAAYKPFYYTRYLEYYDEWYDYKETEPLPDANIAEWKTFTGGTVPEADLDSFIYRFPDESLSNLYYHIEKGTPLKVSAEVQGNGFTKWFIDHKDLEALGYLIYAKQCEPNAQSTDRWDAPTRDSAKMVRLIKNGLQLQKAAKQDFFKWRYAFQAMRMAYYVGNNAQTLDIYNTLIGDRIDGGTMYARCLGLKAGALFRTKENVEAAYLYSLVFDKSDAMKKSAFMSYAWSDGFKNSELVLAKCKSPHERAVIQVMAGLNEYEEALPFLEKAYSIEPQVGGLDVLMTREIQKAEEHYLQPRLLASRNVSASGGGWYNHYDMEWSFTGGDPAEVKLKEPDVKHISYLSKLDAFATKVASEGKAGHRPFWLLSSAYIHFMQDDPAGTSKYLDLAAAQNMSPREHDLHDIINTLYIVKRAKSITPEVESELLPSMKWLDDRATKSAAFNKTYRDLMSTVLVAAYLREHDTVKAIYTFARSMRTEGGGFSIDEDFTDLPGTLLEHISIPSLQACEAFAASGGKTPYEKWLLAKTPYSPSVLKELEGTKYLRQHQFVEAVKVLRDVDKADLEKRILPDPFLFHIPEVHEAYADDSIHTYTKLSFARRMAELEIAMIKHMEADPSTLFDYAMGLYSMTYYGKASTAFTYYRSTSDGYGYYQSPDRDKLPNYLRNFYSANTAEQYFIKAAAATTNPDLRARSLWMAAKCWQKRCPESATQSSDSVYYRYSLTNPYFPRLKETSTQSPFFEQARSSCGYLRDYVERSK